MSQAIYQKTAPGLAFRLPLEPARLLRARQRIRDYLRGRQARPEHVDQVVLALQEAMANAVRHSGAVDELEVELHFEGRDLVAEVRDRGCGFAVETFDPQRVPDTGQVGGRGLYLIARLMDDLRLESHEGLAVRMVKRGLLGEPGGQARTSRPPAAGSHGDLRQQTLLDQIPEACAAFDWEFRYLYVNEPACRLSGRSREDLLGKTLWEVFPEVLGTDIERRLRETMDLGKATSYEFYFPPLDGWFEQRLYPTPSGISQFTSEIGERKERELERRRLADDLDSVLATSRDVVYRLDLRTGRYDYISPSVEAVTGYSVDEFKEMGVEASLKLIHPDDAAAYGEAIRRSQETGRAIVEYRQRTKTGEWRWLSNHIALTQDGKGNATHITGSVRDVSDEHRVGAALRESEQRLRFHLENTPLAVVEWDAEFVVRRWAGEAEAMFGWSAAETVGKRIMDLRLIPTDDVGIVEQTMAELTDGRHTQVVRGNRNVTKDGRVIDCTWFNSVLMDEEGQMTSVMSLVQDETERRCAEEALRQADIEEAAHAERARLARDLHDSVTQALFAASLKAEALTLDGAVSGKARETVEAVDRLTRGALAQMRTLLLELRGESVQDVPIGQLLRTVAEATEGRSSVRVAVTVDGEAELPEALHVAVYRITQEALNNVAKHSRARNAWVRLDAQSSLLRLVVGDDGCGFEPGDTDPSHLGLTSIRERAQETGAGLTLATRPGEGTVLTLTWRRPAG